MAHWVKIRNYRVDLDSLRSYSSDYDFGYAQQPFYIKLVYKERITDKSSIMTIHWPNEDRPDKKPKEWLEVTKMLDDYFGIEKISL